MNAFKRILITPGEPAGIGPDIALQIAQQPWPAELVVIADPELLTARAHQLGLTINLITCQLDEPPSLHQPGSLKILPVHLTAPVQAGQLNSANAHYVIETLKMAAATASKIKSGHGLAHTIVTGPVHKAIINQAGLAFTGHTEFFADYCKVICTVMLFVVDQLRVALATTHLPLADVPHAITKDRLRSVIMTLHNGMQTLFKIPSPHILVCGLNPHAGEGGYLGREEIDIITPLLNELRDEHHYQLTGPLPADTLFTPKYLHGADAVLAMYHDQALPLVKHLGFGHAVNVTLGLPFLRTSVDHGTAIDIAGTGKADPGSMAAALKLAIELS